MSTEHNHGDGGPASSRLCGSLLGASLSLLLEDTPEDGANSLCCTEWSEKHTYRVSTQGARWSDGGEMTHDVQMLAQMRTRYPQPHT